MTAVQDIFTLLINTALLRTNLCIQCGLFIQKKKKKVKKEKVHISSSKQLLQEGKENCFLTLPLAHVARQSAATGSKPNLRHLITCLLTEL